LIEWIVICAGAFVLIALIFPYGIDLPIHVLFGWILFLSRTLSNLRPNGLEILTFCVAIISGITILHFLARSFFKTSAQVHWKLPRSISVILLFALSFISGTAFVGTIQHVRWLGTNQVLDYSDFERSEHDNSKSNLTKIADGVNSYHDLYSSFPAGGSLLFRAIPGHSWQTALLPMLDQQVLYNRIHLEQPWNAQSNRDPFSTRLPFYTHPLIQKKNPQSNPGYSYSHYSGNRFVLPLGRSLTRDEITDGTSQTILAGEVSDNFKPWADPTNSRDPTLGIHTSPEGFGSPWGNSHLYGTHFLMTDGSVKPIKDNIDPKILKALATPDGGEAVGEF